MSKPPLTGSRIRNYRADKGLRQSALAKQCGISPSYLNLIEHNRRRIGGALLSKIARALDVESSVLSGGAEAALATAVAAAAEAHPDIGAEQARADELAGRFPGWARLIDSQHREIRRLEQVIEQLGDRLTHDPYLSASMHNVLSSVTAIRSASAILARGEDVEPEWQERFHRNIYEDSQRLTEATETLVEYLDNDEKQDAKGTLPQDEVDAWLSELDCRVDALERDPDADIGEIVSASTTLVSRASRELAEKVLKRYAEDVRAVPFADLLASVAEFGVDLMRLSTVFHVDLPRIFRRLVTLEAEQLEEANRQPLGLVACDASGTLTFRKDVQGFDMPRYSAACPIWPVFHALGRPMVPVKQTVRMSGREESVFETTSVSTFAYPQGFDGPPVIEAWMLIKPLARLPENASAWRIGPSCRICSEPDCLARREPSVFTLKSDADTLTV